jgi:putative aminopeptidase FrvX
MPTVSNTILTTDKETMMERLEALCQMAAPAGHERRVNRWLSSRWQDKVDRVWLTPVGNLIAHVEGPGPKLMICAHADEIGFVVRGISPGGFLWITLPGRGPRGRPFTRGPITLPTGQGALVVGAERDVPGIFGAALGHLATYEDERPLTWDDLFVDVWAEDREQVRQWGIDIGAPVIWNPPVRRRGDFVTAKAMDDRVGLAIMDVLLDELDRASLQFDLYLTSTILEELGLIGAASVNRDLQCPYAIALDVGLAGDIPTVSDRDLSTRLGGGPLLVHRDLYTYDVPLTRALRAAAESDGIPVQDGVFCSYGSDAGELIKGGAASALLTVPTRYTHSPIETVHLEDVMQSVQLLKVFLEIGIR